MERIVAGGSSTHEEPSDFSSQENESRFAYLSCLHRLKTAIRVLSYAPQEGREECFASWVEPFLPSPDSSCSLTAFAQYSRSLTLLAMAFLLLVG